MAEQRNIIGFNAAPGFVRNPATGKEVVATGRVGRGVIAAHQQGLRNAGVAVPRGTIGRNPGRVAVPGMVIVDYAGRGPPKATGAFRIQEYARQAGRAVTVAEMARDIAATAAVTPNFRQAVVAFEDEEGYRLYRTIHGRTAAEFLNAIDHFQVKGAAAGSDQVGTDYNLDTGGFQIGSVTYPAGAGAKFTGVSKRAGRAHPYFYLIDFSGKAKQGDCLLAVLRAVAKEFAANIPSERNDKLRIRLGIPPGAIEATPANIEALAKKFGLYIRVITGLEVCPDIEREFDDNRTRTEGANLCKSAPINPVVIAEYSPHDAAPECCVYLADNHYEYIGRMLDTVQCPVTGDLIDSPDKRPATVIARRVIAQGRNHYGVKRTAANEKSPRVDRVIIYDYETIYNAEGVIEPYALGFMELDPSAVLEDFKDCAGLVTQIIRREGESCLSVTAPLLDVLASAPPDVHYTLVSFNGARFDHYILAKAAQNRAMLSGVFATAGAGLRSLNIGRHTTLDMAKLCPAMSLAGACEGFATSPTKMDGFNHIVVQRAANDGKLYTWLEDNAEQLAEYLGRDILSTASLFTKVSKTLTELSGSSVYGLKAIGTIGGHAWTKMKEMCHLPGRVSTHELDKTIRSAIVGGRVQCYREGKRHDLAQANMLDFASLYPTAMACPDKVSSIFDPLERWGYYPSGEGNSEPTAVSSWTPGDVGIYRATIHSQPEGLPNVLPRRGDTLEWDYRGEFETWATHIDLALITNGGGRITVHEGLTWPVYRPAIFKKFIDELAAGKDAQDELLRTGDERYNPALRMMFKLLMNSASGKCCQNNYDDSVELATGSVAQLNAERKLDQDAPITWIPLGGETCIIMGKKLTTSVYKKSAKPSILAVLIYSYSRALVWRTLCQHNIIYGDTDSGLFERADYEAIRAAFPQLDPTGRKKELGDLEEELKPHSRAVAYTLAPKDYAVFLYGEDGAINARASKLRVKGVNMRTDRLINLSNEPTEREATILDIKGQTMAEHTEAYHAHTVEQSAPLSDINTINQFYTERAAGKRVAIYTSQMVRCYRDPMNPFSLEQRFMVKEL
jgi:hypothetical protein